MVRGLLSRQFRHQSHIQLSALKVYKSPESTDFGVFGGQNAIEFTGALP
jgi:hypothetical protein